MSMLFHSTRGQCPAIGIREVALAGLAPDGGLYLPVAWPQFSPSEIAAMRGQSYAQVAFTVLRPFMQGAMPDEVLRGIIDKSYAVFDIAEVVRIRELGDGLRILELFHGPSLAFKDIALQFLGHVFEYFLRDADYRLTLVGATSGDTGSAAMAAMAGRRNIDLFVLYPEKGPSEIQRRQMTCVEAPNVHALAVRGNFDDCQALVKQLFAGRDLRAAWHLTTVNSINLLRILAQMVYYFYAAAAVAPDLANFVVPTGNFGDVYAGYAAHCCGLPVGRLVVASNSNDILTRFFAGGRMQVAPVQGTLSPSMDIQVSSNFERLLYDLCGADSEKLRGLMRDLQGQGGFALGATEMAVARRLFGAASADDAQTIDTIRHVYQTYGYLADPHTAVGIQALRSLRGTLTKNTLCLATAHPAKFKETINKIIGLEVSLPQRIEALIRRPERTRLVPAEVRDIIGFVEERKNHGRPNHDTG